MSRRRRKRGRYFRGGIQARRVVMSEATAVVAGRTAWRGGLGTDVHAVRTGPDGRRVFQLVLAGIWLVDAMLQYQPFMFTKAFGQMLAGTAPGNPPVIA